MTFQPADGRIQFRLYRPEVQFASVAGEFNGWDPKACPMKREEDGYWSCTMELPPGSYQFRYFLDGSWANDGAAFGFQPGPFGWNSVVYVRPSLAA
jgi:1,4-alpha-glucan branching enzyme